MTREARPVSGLGSPVLLGPSRGIFACGERIITGCHATASMQRHHAQGVMILAKLSHGSQAQSSPGDPPLERRSPGQVGQALLVEIKARARSSPHLLAKPTQGRGQKCRQAGVQGGKNQRRPSSKAANQANSEQLFATF